MIDYVRLIECKKLITEKLKGENLKMKKLVIFAIAASMLAASAAAFAENDDILNQPAVIDDVLPTPVIQGDIMLISGAPSVMPSYASHTAVVTEISEERIATTTNTDDAENFENTINFNINKNTLVYEDVKGDKKSVSDIKVGDKITVFTGAYEPTPMILPPQYVANVVIINSAAEGAKFADVDTYLENGEEFVNAANTLAVSTDEKTKVVDIEDKEVKDNSLANKDLIVFYTASTKSMPAKTTAEKIVVVGENETALKNIEAAKTESIPVPEAEPTKAPEENTAVDYSKIKTVKVGENNITNIYKNAEGTLMLPLREIAEAFDMSVKWDGKLKAVMINDGMYSLQIGVNQYGKGRMMPMELSAAPEITTDLTYVPVDYFTDVIETEMNVSNDTLEFSVNAD